MNNMFGNIYDDDPFGEGVYEDEMYQGLDAFGSTGVPYDVAYGEAPMGIGYLDDDQLVAAKRRIDLLKALRDYQFDSRTGYYGAVEEGRPTFNFPGLTAGEGVEQAGTAEAGTQEGDIIGFDMEGNPIMSAASKSGGGGGGSGRGSGMAPEEANRFLQSLSNSSRETIKLIPETLEKEGVLGTKLMLQEGLGPEADPETLKLMYDTVDKAWEASNVVTGTTLPKQSDLGVQVGKWGTVDPTKAYTPDTLPEDVLPMLGEDYVPMLDRFQSQYDEANEGFNRYLKANKDAFQTWAPQKELERDEALKAAGFNPGGGALRPESSTYMEDRFNAVPGAKSGEVSGYEYDEPEPGAGNQWLESRQGAMSARTQGQPAPTGAVPPPLSFGNRSNVAQQPGQEGSAVNPIVDAIVAVANQGRGANTPFAKTATGGLLDTAIDVDVDEAKALGLKGWDTWKMLPGGKRQVYTTQEGAQVLNRKRQAQRSYEKQTKDNQWLREYIARDLAAKGRTPQRDDMRSRQASTRQALGF